MPIRSGILGIEERLTVYHLDRFRRYLKLLNPHIQQSRQEWENEIQQKASQIGDPDERDQFLESYSDEYWEFEEYESILCNYFLVAVYAFVEASLGSFCHTCRNQKKLALSWSDLKGDALERAAKYLSKVAGLDFPYRTKEWNAMRRYEKLRHAIVHREATLSKGKEYKGCEDVWRFAARERLIKADGSVTEDVIMLTPKFCEQVLDNTQRFLTQVHHALHRTLSSGQSL